MTNQITPETLSKVSNELSELIYKAKKVGYKNLPPRLPKNPTKSTMSGFHKRFKNWSNSLILLESEIQKQVKHTIKANPNLLEKYTNNN